MAPSQSVVLVGSKMEVAPLTHTKSTVVFFYLSGPLPQTRAGFWVPGPQMTEIFSAPCLWKAKSWFQARVQVSDLFKRCQSTSSWCKLVGFKGSFCCFNHGPSFSWTNVVTMVNILSGGGNAQRRSPARSNGAAVRCPAKRSRTFWGVKVHKLLGHPNMWIVPWECTEHFFFYGKG